MTYFFNQKLIGSFYITSCIFKCKAVCLLMFNGNKKIFSMKVRAVSLYFCKNKLGKFSYSLKSSKYLALHWPAFHTAYITLHFTALCISMYHPAVKQEYLKSKSNRQVCKIIRCTSVIGIRKSSPKIGGT